jgi:hypothetical protein
VVDRELLRLIGAEQLLDSTSTLRPASKHARFAERSAPGMHSQVQVHFGLHVIHIAKLYDGRVVLCKRLVFAVTAKMSPRNSFV